MVAEEDLCPRIHDCYEALLNIMKDERLGVDGSEIARRLDALQAEVAELEIAIEAKGRELTAREARKDAVD